MQLSTPFATTLQCSPLDWLERRCTEEMQRYFKQQPADNQFSHELLRRALLLQDERAWASTYQLYQPLVAGWLKQRLRWPINEMEWQTLIDDTFLRMRATFVRHPEKFNDYPNLNALLGLLRRCSERVVQDYVEKCKQQAELLPLDEDLPTGSSVQAAPDPHALWMQLAAWLHNEQEQLVVQYLFVDECKPRHLYADYPHLFQDVDEINTIRERVKARLRRNREFYAYLHTMSEN